MKTPLARLLIATGVALALFPGSTALASDQAGLPVGSARGVRLVDDRGALVLIFSHPSGRLRQRINSRYAWIECTHLGDVFGNSFGGNLDITHRHGRRVPIDFGADGADYCRFFLRAHTVRRHHSRHRVSRHALFSIPLTQAGAVYLDEESKARRMFTIILVASIVKDDRKLPGIPTYAQLLEAHPQLAEVVVELNAPGDSPPPKRIGYYSDGHEHVALTILSASGKRLFIEESAGNVLSTNVAAHLFGDQD